MYERGTIYKVNVVFRCQQYEDKVCHRCLEWMQRASLALYRKLVRSASQFPVKPIARKLLYNIREVFESHREEQQPRKIVYLQDNAEAALRLLASLRHLPEVC